MERRRFVKGPESEGHRPGQDPEENAGGDGQIHIGRGGKWTQCEETDDGKRRRDACRNVWRGGRRDGRSGRKDEVGAATLERSTRI